ncbi:D-alanyl-D-alanine carboxypeptidase/D-alanyl-D-alanine endopeptidase [Streptomyces varsoviensis]|uniref:D-alanyl-D-alanine carboxypeptidase/D-alanyl-D-alanine endopeptidase n=1 Tax=Streptomyces varsoviensis TaxID=67373 RepID=UPI0006627C21|nr:D-alanyl-D-alanine carboxypeptidase/D-alanyl-D-alanine-endopeptidase [Streptomyces varsoviensis]
MVEARSWQIRRWQEATKAQRATWRYTAAAAVVGLFAAGGAVALAGPWDSGQRTAERAHAAAGPAAGGENHSEHPAGAPPVLAALGGNGGPDAVPPPTGTGLADALEPLLKDDALGSKPSASVVDVATGRQLFGSGQGQVSTPASTIKPAVAVAALSALGPDHRIPTTVVRGKDGIVLVGGGDPTLTARAVKPGLGSHTPASLRKLADDTARALKAQGTREVRLGYDTSRYSGPGRHPIGLNENVALVTPLMADEGRKDGSDHGPADRVADPARAAATTFASMLRDRGIDIDGDPAAAKADSAAEQVAVVHSMPLSALVERALTNSDNDIAEALARQTALAEGRPASFAGAAEAVTARLRALGLPLDGVHIADGSGLDRDDKASPALLAQVLVRAADPRRPELRPVLTGLPIAGFSGTLRDRYDRDSPGRGFVRAKTGTLTGVNTLAGLAVDADGRLMAFAFMTRGAASGDAAQHSLDRLASAVANCGCR